MFSIEEIKEDKEEKRERGLRGDEVGVDRRRFLTLRIHVREGTLDIAKKREVLIYRIHSKRIDREWLF